MTSLLVTPDELGTYLGISDDMDEDRATLILADAQSACEQVINPVPPSKLFVLRRVAMRAYLAGSGQGRSYQVNQGGGDQAPPAPASGVYLTSKDQADLLATPSAGTNLTGTSAFTIYASVADDSTCDYGTYP